MTAETRPPVLVTRRLPQQALDRITAVCDMTLYAGEDAMPRGRLLAEAAGKAGAVTLLTDRVDEEFLDAAGPQLTIVANYAVGFDNIDLDAARARGIAVGNTPDVLTDATADLTFTLLLAAARRLPEAFADARSGEWIGWEPAGFLGAEVHGQTLGIIGYGRIGRAVARRAEGFEMHARSMEGRIGDNQPG